MSRDNERLDHLGQTVGANYALRTSNLTSGHFLGTVPREWMLNGSNGQTADTANQSSIEGTPRRTAALTANTDTVQNSYPRPKDVEYSFVPVPVSDASFETQTSPATGPQSTGTISLSDAPAEDNSNVRQTTEIPVIDLDGVASHPTPLPVTDQSTSAGYTTVSPSNTTFQGLSRRSSEESSASTRNGLFERVTGPQTLRYNAPGQPRAGNVLQAELPRNSRAPTYVPSLTPSRIITNAPLSNSAPTLSSPRPRGQLHNHVQINSSQLPTPSPVLSMNNTILSQPSAPAQSGLVQSLDARTSLIKAQKALSPVDQMRVTGLRAACALGDATYVLLHQLSCLHTGHPKFLKAYLTLAPADVNSLVAINDILADNRKLSSEVLAEFCNFPFPLTAFTTIQSYQNDVLRAKQFLNFFAPRWEIMKATVLPRRIPPCAREVAELIVWNSPILSQAIFSYCFCLLFPHASPLLSEKALKLFRTSQEAYNRSTRMHYGVTSTPQSASALHQELRAFARDFQEVLSSHNQHISRVLRQVVSDVEHPSLPSPVLSPSQSIPPRASNGITNSGTNRPHDSTPHTSPAGRGNTPTTAMPSNFARAPATAPPVVPSSGPPRIFPDPGQLLPITVNPDPNRSALHQAHLSRRALALSNVSLGHGSERRLYAFLERFLDQPKLISKDTVFETWSVSVPSDVFRRRADDHPAAKNNPLGQPARAASHGSIVFHLRCFEVISSSFDEAECSAAPTFWPEHLFVSINGNHLEFRRKTLHGRDLPVEISHVLNEGSNEFKLSYHANTRESDKSFAIVPEIIVFCDHQHVLEFPKMVPAALSLSTITSSLHVHDDDDDDDDIVMANAHVSIDLIDPFTARVFDRPVRGRMCRHRECFDLEAFLQSRNCRFKDGTVQPDEWKCPLCGKDARPSSLLEDAFLLEVKAKLMAENKSDAKAILVNPDGTWESKVDNAATSNHKPDAAHRDRKSRSASGAVHSRADHDGVPAKPVPEIATNDPEIVDLAGDSDG